MDFPLLSRGDAVHLPARHDLACSQLILRLGFADRRGGRVGRDRGLIFCDLVPSDLGMTALAGIGLYSSLRWRVMIF
jgi:hypothetical protein